MHDAFLKFTDHAEALAAFEALGLQLDALAYHDTDLPAGMLIVKAVGSACDGLVHGPTGESETDAEGFEYPVTAAVPGFHVNIRLADGAELPEALSAFLVAPQPETPSERFA
ncbi:hypothetical protein [Martelella soudanensis]|uniref:hypothetical protein n=1 Tax=unclassified Martelella TaxID=2629616 RepID=UPI0015DEDF42|nr:MULTISPECIES: hypothetical protein [unclassified Martelella]